MIRTPLIFIHPAHPGGFTDFEVDLPLHLTYRNVLTVSKSVMYLAPVMLLWSGMSEILRFWAVSSERRWWKPRVLCPAWLPRFMFLLLQVTAPSDSGTATAEGSARDLGEHARGALNNSK